LWRGGLSFRRLWVLIKHLPAESWTQTALRDADDGPEDLSPPEVEQRHGPWALSNYQLVRLVDEVASLRFVTARGLGFAEYPEPEPTPRPGARSRKPQRGLSEAAVVYLNKLRPTGG